jgi:hypothetical protein
MTLPSIRVLVDALTDPTSLTKLTTSEWDLLIRQARSSALLARVATTISDAHLMEFVPLGPRRHLESAVILSNRQQRELRTEVNHIVAALSKVKVPVVLLKGAAYVMSGRTAAEGRTMSDVDILVPKNSLSDVESALMMRGWETVAKSAYDQRYYRQWMHELPPMQHIHRSAVIDVHHAIVPLSSRSHPDTDTLLKAALPAEEGSAVKVLSPVDMIIHSAAHLFHEGEFEQGFRGVVDLDALLREFGRDSVFWPELVPRAKELELLRPVFYALRYASLLLNTPIPAVVGRTIADESPALSSTLFLRGMDWLFLRALRPAHQSAADKWTPLARWLLYLRGHWLRMPPFLLVAHLLRKLVLSTTLKTDSGQGKL